MKNLLFYISTTAIISLASCHGTKEGKEHNQDSLQFDITLSNEKMSRMDIQTGFIKKSALNKVIRGTGRICITPNSEAIVSSCIPGKASKIYVVEGQQVKRGQPLLSLSSFELIELQENYLSAKNDAHFYVHEYERQQELRSKNIGSLADFQNIESKYFNALNNKESLGGKLLLIGIDTALLMENKESAIQHTLDIKSPIDGQVFKLEVTIGQRIEPNAELARIIDISSMYAEVNIYEKDIDMLNIDQEVFVDFVNESLPHLTGSIFNIAKSIDPDTRSIKAYVRLGAIGNSRILPGMAIKTEIKGLRANTEPHFITPITGLLQEGELYYIFVITSRISNDITFRKTKVFIGENDGDHAEIMLSDISTDSINIVTQNVYLVNNELAKKDEQ